MFQLFESRSTQIKKVKIQEYHFICSGVKVSISVMADRRPLFSLCAGFWQSDYFDALLVLRRKPKLSN